MSETEQDTIEEQDAEANENVEAAVDESQAVDEQVAAPKSEKVSVENLRVLENIEVNLTVVVGGTELKIRDLLRLNEGSVIELDRLAGCLLYTSPSPRDRTRSRMPSSA